jgi:hypothetical protein
LSPFNVGSIRVILTNQVNSNDVRTTEFGLEQDTLISLSGALGANVRLLRR